MMKDLKSSAVACQRLEFEPTGMSRREQDVGKKDVAKAATKGGLEVLSEGRSLEKEWMEYRWKDSLPVLDLMLRLLG